MRKLYLFLSLFFICTILFANPKREIRAVWLTTNWALDWPISKDAATQQREMKLLLNKLADININTIIFQVQCRADVFWESDYQPWSRYLTGNPGQEPTYDVLQFVIDECHERNMEVHAWVVPYPLGDNNTVNHYGDDHVLNKRPDLCVTHSGNHYLDPGLPETTEYLLGLYGELVDKYDFDGVNLDYTRYPDANFPDSKSYSLYGNGMDKSDWRRNNINQFVHALYDMIKEKKPEMKLGAAPIGAYERLPDAQSGWFGYSAVFQDAVNWMQNEKLDFNAPQVYWKANYEPHMRNWIQKSNGRHTVAGLAAYKMLSSEEDWDASVIIDQIEKAREMEADGVCFFRAAQITTSNTKKIHTLLQEDLFKYPAHLPVMGWKEKTKPATPVNLSITHKENDTYVLRWEGTDAEAGYIPPKYYSVYSSNSETIDFEDVTNIAVHAVKENSIEYTIPDLSQDTYFAVTAFDKNYYESDPSIIVKVEKPVNMMQEISKAVKFLYADNKVTVTSQLEIGTVDIYAVNGVKVASESYNSFEVSVDTQSMMQGVYIVVVELVDGSILKYKFIK